MSKKRINSGLFTNRTDEWATPALLFDSLDKEFGFKLDAAASSKNAQCKNYYTKRDNSLTKDWHTHKSVFLNPPYSMNNLFLEKAYQEAQKGATVVCLIPFRSDTAYYHDWVFNKANEVRLIKGRLKYNDGDGSAPFPSAIIIYTKGTHHTNFTTTDKLNNALNGHNITKNTMAGSTATRRRNKAIAWGKFNADVLYEHKTSTTMITVNNYSSQISKINLNDLPEALQEGNNFFNEVTNHSGNLKIYQAEPEIKETIDIYLKKLNEYAKKPSKMTRVPIATKTIARTKTVATNKALGGKSAKLPVSVDYINSYVAMDGKKVTEQQVFSLLSSIQKAILEKRIRKTDPKAKIIIHIQQQLIKLYRGMDKQAIIEIADVEKYKGLGTVWPLVATYVASRVVGNTINKGIELVKKEFKKKPPKKGKSKNKGLGCAGTCTCQKPVNGLGSISAQPSINYPPVVATIPETVATTQPNSGRMSVNEAISTKYDLINLDGEWLDLIGEACRPTSFFIYGPGGSGKSTFTVKFANYMAQKGNKVLYVAGEQFRTPAFAKLLQRLTIVDSSNFVIAKDLTVENPDNYDIVVLDSKDSLGTELQDFITLRKRYPKQSYVILSQSTKDGNFTGSEKWRNEVDTMIVCQNGIAYTNRDKNRWGGSGEMKIF